MKKLIKKALTDKKARDLKALNSLALTMSVAEPWGGV